MKKLLLIIALVSVGVNAEDNPFSFQENFQKIDKDQDVLLSALKEMSDKKEGESTVTEELISEQAKAEEERVAKQELEKKEAEKKELEKQKIAKLAAQKREKKRREIEVYETQKIAKKQAEAIVDIDITREQYLAKRKSDREYLEAIQEVR